jgi:hypothetical protein
MATGVQIADIYNPILWNKGIQEAAIEQNRFLNSGVMVNNSELASMASASSTIGEIPFFKGLTNDEPNYSSDDSAVLSSPAKISGAKQIYRKVFKNKSWATMDLAVEIGAVDPVAAITGRIGKYWAVDTEKRVINSLKGVLADNIANDSSDMMASVATLETGASPTAAKSLSGGIIIDALTTLGDLSTSINTIAMHSICYATLQKLNLIIYLPYTDQTIKIPTYLGLRVVVDDSLAPRAGTTSGFVYTSILFGADSIGYGAGKPPVPSEVFRNPSAGNGSGQDVIFSRATEIIHPWGFQFTSSSVAGQSATYAELAAAANWNRIYVNRKNIPLAFVQTNA